jgi:4-amino-4-deoxy-L-arabinose transferase-like glycosyltransferase
MNIVDKEITAPRSMLANLLLSTNTWASRLVWQLAPPLIFLVLVFFFFPYSARFEFSTDEGIELMKAMLVEQGYSLYGDIWSDQPPLFTYLLATAFHFFGLKVGVGRFVVLIFSSILLWAAFQLMRTTWSKGHALAAVMLIFLLPKYMLLSAAAMIGLPSISLAMLALLFLTYWHLRPKNYWLFLSATALGLSVLTKIFTGFLAPIFLAGILVHGIVNQQNQRSWQMILSPAILWMAVFTIFTLASGFLLVGPGNVSQLLEPHLAATAIEDFRNNDILTIHWHLKKSLPTLFLALVGFIFTLRSKRWLGLYPFAWAITAYLLLSFHAPVWDHQQLLVTIPAALLAAVAVHEALTFFWKIVQTHYAPSLQGFLRAAAIIGLFLVLFTFRTPEPISLMSPQPSLTNSEFELGPLTEKFFVKMLKFAPQTNWVVTDLPMYAFRARLPVPPDLAVFSSKRITTGNLTEGQIMQTILKYQPEQILLGRFTYPNIDKYLRENYRLVHSKDEMKLYIRRDLGG